MRREKYSLPWQYEGKPGTGLFGGLRREGTGQAQWPAPWV